MFRRDYLLKLIQELFAAIARVLEKEGSQSEQQKQIESLYAAFGEDKDFFRSASEEDIISSVARVAAYSAGVAPSDVPASEMCDCLELLAALFYADFSVSNLQPSLRYDVALRALALYLRVCDMSDTYSQERFDRMEELQTYLKDFDEK